jgi:hypothetical protein
MKQDLDDEIKLIKEDVDSIKNIICHDCCKYFNISEKKKMFLYQKTHY